MVFEFLYAIVFTIFEVLLKHYSNQLSFLEMKKMSYLKLAKKVQEIYLDKSALGKYNDTDIYFCSLSALFRRTNFKSWQFTKNPSKGEAAKD